VIHVFEWFVIRVYQSSAQQEVITTRTKDNEASMMGAREISRCSFVVQDGTTLMLEKMVERGERRFGSRVHMHPLFQTQFKHILNWQKNSKKYVV
jgi:hypothetical protein